MTAVMPRRVTLPKVVHNGEAPWDKFDSLRYWEHNYKTLRDDDEKIICQMEDFFTQHPPVDGAKGIDVGPGPNLYPALAMLPLCSKITLWEYSAANVRWLRQELKSYRATWDVFWGKVKQRLSKDGVPAVDPRASLARRAEVVQRSIFDLPLDAFDLGTMFFVAESLTSDFGEFEKATHKFLTSLKAGAPFAAAFMAGSKGYRVGEYRFPAVPVTIEDVERCLTGLTHDLKLVPIDSRNPLREGYSGMILALGRAGA